MRSPIALALAARHALRPDCGGAQHRLQRARRQSVVPAAPWDPLGLHRGEGRGALSRHRRRDARDSDDRRLSLRRRLRPALSRRAPRGAHHGLVQPGHPRQRLVLRRANGRARRARQGHEYRRHLDGRRRRRPAGPLHASPPARRPIGAPGVLQGSCGGSLHGDRPVQHRDPARRARTRSWRRKPHGSSRGRSTTRCTCAGSAPCSSRPSAAGTRGTSSSL